ncbi:MAG TPA: zf-HC2 domain-containing protein [Bryobacteraceae bacterium]|nr:zf-HC2 domain-containing protein [Bryobacteraceae bacterium]
MTCADFEIRICDYVDGTLAPAERVELERHLAVCASCAELARDSAAAVTFMERASEVEPPPELLTRLLFEPPWRKSGAAARSGARRWLAGLLHPLLQPRFAMGMAMTILSFAMLYKFVGPIRQLRPQDLEPARVWAALDDRLYRGWQRTVKFYESIRFVYQIRNQLQEWQQQQEEEQRTAPPDAQKSGAGADDRRLLPRNPPRSGEGARPSEMKGKNP